MTVSKEKTAALTRMLRESKLYMKLRKRYEETITGDTIVYTEPRTGFRVLASFEGDTLKIWFEYDREELRDILEEEDEEYVKGITNDVLSLIETIAYTASHKWRVVKDVSSLLDLINILEEQE